MISRGFQSSVTGVIAAVVLVGGSAPGAASRLAAPVGCAAIQVGAASLAQINVAARRGCVLPMIDEVAQVPVVEAVDPVNVAIPQRAAGLPRGLIIAGALASGLAVAFFAFKDDDKKKRRPVSG